VSFCIATSISCAVVAQDWPQWRGANRDAKAAGFEAPQTWPPELTQSWQVKVGDGVATPALVGDRLYVFTREEENEVLRCLDAASGNEVWQDKYPAEPVRGPASSFSGPRSSPTVADGKVVTLGVQGTLSCVDAATGKVVWRKADFEGSVPNFATASSPIVVDGLCIAQLGGQDNGDGAIVAYDLTTGEEKWKWTGDSPAYGSPVLLAVNGTQAVVTPTDQNMVALDAASGQLLWQMAYRQGRYNSATPIIEDQTLILAGPDRGTTAVKLQKEGEELAAMEAWSNPDNSLMYNTPVLKDGMLYGISTLNSLFCVDAESGETKWNAPLGAETAQQEQDRPRREGQQEGREGRQGRRGGRRGGGRGGYGSVVDAGTVLFALTPTGQLVVFAPNPEEFQQIASYKVAQAGTYAYPIASGNRIFIKDQDAVTLWTVE
jgi:outer membrane protein assembly factor BamB